MTNPIRKTIIFLKKKLNIKEESYLDGASGSSYPINISKPTPGSVLHHEAPQEVLDTLKLRTEESHNMFGAKFAFSIFSTENRYPFDASHVNYLLLFSRFTSKKLVPPP